MSQSQRQRSKNEEVSKPMGLHDVTVGTHTCSIGKFSAVEGWKLLHKLTKSAGTMMGSLSSQDPGRLISDLLLEISDEELIKLLRQLTSICLIDGRKPNDIDLGDYAFTLELCGEVIKHNFGDFFSQVTEALSAIGQRNKAQT